MRRRMTAWAEIARLFGLIESMVLFSDCGMRPEPADPIRATLQLIVKGPAADRQDRLTSLWLMALHWQPVCGPAGSAWRRESGCTRAQYGDANIKWPQSHPCCCVCLFLCCHVHFSRGFHFVLSEQSLAGVRGNNNNLDWWQIIEG